MDSAIGLTPNLDDDAASNLSATAIVKHRSYAEAIGDLTLPAEKASCYEGLQELNEPKNDSISGTPILLGCRLLRKRM